MCMAASCRSRCELQDAGPIIAYPSRDVCCDCRDSAFISDGVESGMLYWDAQQFVVCWPTGAATLASATTRSSPAGNVMHVCVLPDQNEKEAREKFRSSPHGRHCSR